MSITTHLRVGRPSWCCWSCRLLLLLLVLLRAECWNPGELGWMSSLREVMVLEMGFKKDIQMKEWMEGAQREEEEVEHV